MNTLKKMLKNTAGDVEKKLYTEFQAAELFKLHLKVVGFKKFV